MLKIVGLDYVKFEKGYQAKMLLLNSEKKKYQFLDLCYFNIKIIKTIKVSAIGDFLELNIGLIYRNILF